MRRLVVAVAAAVSGALGPPTQWRAARASTELRAVGPGLPHASAVAAAGACWVTYSIAVARRARRRFAAMRCVAAIASQNGTAVADFAAALPPKKSDGGDLLSADSKWERLWPPPEAEGDDEGGKRRSSSKRRTWRVTGAEASVRVATGAGDAASVYAIDDGVDASRPLGDVVRELVRLRRPQETVEDLPTLVRWLRALRRGDSEADDATPPRRGAVYKFVFRDYINFEELAQMLVKRRAITAAIFRLGDDSAFEMTARSMGDDDDDDDDDPPAVCSLSDSFVLLGVFPVSVRWDGVEREAGRIDWTATEARFGWRRLGRTVRSLPTAEKLRQAPWFFTTLNDAETIVFRREGVGRLVFTAAPAAGASAS